MADSARVKHPKDVTLKWAGIMADNLDDEMWSKVACHIAPALSPMDSLKGVRKSIENRESQLWVVFRGSEVVAAIVTKITQHDKGKVFTIAQCGGKDIREWLNYVDILYKYARFQKCDKIVLVGREGWLRMLDGFEKTGVVLEKTL